jgi:hypothetical protein
MEARGITVGATRAFDNRALTLMLESLNASLAGLNVIDQKMLAGAVGRVQGSQLTEVSREFVLQGMATPQVQEVTGATGGTTSNVTGSTGATTGPAGATTATQAGTVDTSQTGTSQTETTTTPSTTPVVPAGPAVPGAPSAFANLQYSLSPSDLLSEQVNVMYQIFNIRMLLDRALGDRLLWEGQPQDAGNTRLQAVLGTNVWIDPPRDAVNAAAVIEMTIELPNGVGNEQRPALVAVMPQERTYNSAALSSKSNAFGGSAVANVFTVGVTEKRRGQTFYLYRENDTVAFERQADPRTPNAITYGWVFRPVLGRRSVLAGPRQMFAVVSLPVNDGPNAADRHVRLKAGVRAYWRKYDPDTLTTADRDRGEIRFWARAAHLLSLGTSLNYPPDGVTEVSGYTIDVPLTRSLARDLKPEIDKVMWRPVGARLAVVAVHGRNLFHDTRVVLGDRVLATPADGLRLVSDQALDVTTSIASLAADAAVLGRYGPAEPLEVTCHLDCKPSLAAITASWNDSVGGVIEATVDPMFGTADFATAECLHPDDLKDEGLGHPVLFLNGIPIEGPYEFVPTARQGSPATSCVAIVARIPDSAAKQFAGILSLKFPFRGKAFQASQRIYDPRTAFKARLIAADDYLLEKIDGSFGEEGTWRVVIPGAAAPLILEGQCDAGAAFCLPAPYDRFARLRPPPASEEAGKPSARLKPDVILLQSRYGTSWGATYPITLPSASPKATGPTLDKGQTAWVNQHDEVWRTFSGTSLSNARAHLPSGATLRSRPVNDGKGIEVLLTSDVTRLPRAMDISIVNDGGTPIGVVHVAVRRTEDGKETAR